MNVSISSKNKNKQIVLPGLSSFLARLLTLLICLYASCNGPHTYETDLGSDSESSDTGTDTQRSPNCNPNDIRVISQEISAAISTVGIVEWSTSIQPLSSAVIEFSLDDLSSQPDDTQTAPVALDSISTDGVYRSVLLGMKPASVYHYRITVNDCSSAKHTIETGPIPVELPSISNTAIMPAMSANGFIVSSTGMKSHFAYIIDRDGDYVWWYPFTPTENSGRMDGIARARMSADGRTMWAGSINMACGCGYLFSIPMDGLGAPTVIPVDRHHDFTVLPDNTVAYIEYTDDGDRIVERNQAGETRTIYSFRDDFSGEGIDWSHCNAIHYYPKDDSYTVSCLSLNSIVKINRATGTLIWDLNSTGQGDFTGVTWAGQHGHQILDNGNILFFTNSGLDRDSDTTSPAPQFLSSSEAVELALDITAGSINEIWYYASENRSLALGDVQRLPNGNTLVTYSSAGVIHEVTSSGELVRRIDIDGLGYADWRPILYGEPARY
ncbi:MAG: aryl-sulfate sulfotransferase [Deltaproteobacteria bacterium]|nr:aryl-sulfate sulfotransferase [Deltaproteobacteria bacterium]